MKHFIFYLINSPCSLSINKWFPEVPVKHCQFSCSVPSTGFQGWWCCWSRRAAEPGCLPGSRLGPSLWASLWPEETAGWMTAKTPSKKWSHYWMYKHHVKTSSFLPCDLQNSIKNEQDLKEKQCFSFQCCIKFAVIRVELQVHRKCHKKDDFNLSKLDK